MNNHLYLELSDNKHHKFYELSVNNSLVTVSYGRIGRTGKSSIKQFPTSKEAIQFFHNQIKHKLKRGYQKAVKGETEPRGRFPHIQQLRIPFL